MLQRPRSQTQRPVPKPVSRSGPPMFLYGLGAAKCGTTWLYEYLRKHPECHLRGVKEMNYFDAIDGHWLNKSIDVLSEKTFVLEKSLSEIASTEQAKISADLVDARDYMRVLQTCHQDKNAYFRYMMMGLSKQKLVADLTPNYLNVSADMLRKMAASAPQTRFLLIMRDPLARFWSHVRMSARNSLAKDADFVTEVRARLRRAFDGQEFAINSHSNYAGVLSKIEAAIPAERRLVMFYEDLMTTDGLRSLCKFLGIKPISADFERQVYVGRPAEMTDEERAAMRRFLRPQYEAVASRFPVLPKAWQKTIAEGFA